MPLLLYCMIEAELQRSSVSHGVQGAAVEQVCDSGLCCFYSHIDQLASDSASVKDSALRFHHVVSSVFAQAAVVPFRFPTLVADVNEFTSHLREHAAEYRDALVRLRGMVQMEVRISTAPPSAVRESGTQYLRNRQERYAQLHDAAYQVRNRAQSILGDWRERDTNQGLRCYALVPRPQVKKFQEMLRSVEAPKGAQVTATGPWPATEFIKPEEK